MSSPVGLGRLNHVISAPCHLSHPPARLSRPSKAMRPMHGGYAAASAAQCRLFLRPLSAVPHQAHVRHVGRCIIRKYRQEMAGSRQLVIARLCISKPDSPEWSDFHLANSLVIQGFHWGRYYCKPGRQIYMERIHRAKRAKVAESYCSRRGM